jgi:diphthamide biosynthesis protein 2
MNIPVNSDDIVLYIGPENSRQYSAIVLRFSSTCCTPRFWSWDPTREEQLVTEISSAYQRQLNQRFYWIQKAKLCSVFGILVANLSDNTHIQAVVRQIRQVLEQHGRLCYTLAVGKIQPTKLANFAEIECFVLVACPEQTLNLLDPQTVRDYAAPIITPLELSMALDMLEWGQTPYSLNTSDYLEMMVKQGINYSSSNGGIGNVGKTSDNDDDSDAPQFSLITGRYESVNKRTTSASTRSNDMTTAETTTPRPPQSDVAQQAEQQQLIKYYSPAAEFLKQREYQGLQVQMGTTPVQAAMPGQQGIASDYGNR